MILQYVLYFYLEHFRSKHNTAYNVRISIGKVARRATPLLTFTFGLIIFWSDLRLS